MVENREHCTGKQIWRYKFLRIHLNPRENKEMEKINPNYLDENEV